MTVQTRKSTRRRQAMTLTLSLEGVEIVTRYAEKRDGNRSEAVDAIVGRYAQLLAIAEPLPLSLLEFRLQAQLANGTIFPHSILPSVLLKSNISSRLADLALCESDTTFPDDAEGRTEILNEVRDEQKALDSLIQKIASLSELHCMLVIEAIEELYGADDPNLESRCSQIYNRLTERRPSRIGF